MCVQNLKFVALPVPEIIAVSKNWAVPRYDHAPLSPKFLWPFAQIQPANVSAKFEVYSFKSVPEIIGAPHKFG